MILVTIPTLNIRIVLFNRSKFPQEWMRRSYRFLGIVSWFLLVDLCRNQICQKINLLKIVSMKNLSIAHRQQMQSLQAQQPLGVRVLLTTLKKLYLQSGSGRKNSALFRGLDQRGRALVPEIIQLLKSEGLIIKAGDDEIWIPTRSESLRVKQIMAAPFASRDALIIKASKLG